MFKHNDMPPVDNHEFDNDNDINDDNYTILLLI